MRPALLASRTNPASTIRISTPPSLRITCDRSNDAPQTGSSICGRGRVEAGEAGVDDRAGAIDAGEERRGEAGAGRRHAAPSGLEDGVALGMLHPDESSVAGMALLEIAHARRKRVAGRDFRAVAGDKHRADPADPVWA